MLLVWIFSDDDSWNNTNNVMSNNELGFEKEIQMATFRGNREHQNGTSPK